MKISTFILTVLFTIFCSCKNQKLSTTASTQEIEDIFIETSMNTPFVDPTIHVKKLDTSEKPIRLVQVKTDIRIAGPVSITTWELVFYNPNDRILEGEFNFPLPEGSSISRFALDIDGKLREGVSVEKTKGRRVFEDVIRQQIDPALLEQTEGNNFRARIYPLPPKGERRIVIGYEQPLKVKKNHFYYHLPLGYKNLLENFELTVSVINPENPPQIIQTPYSDIEFSKEKNDYSFSWQQTTITPEGNILLSIPFKKESLTLIEKGIKENELFFYSYVKPERDIRLREKPAEVDIYWDCSLSLEEKNREKEFELLEIYLNELNKVNVKLHLFNCLTTTTETYTIQQGNWSKLKERLLAVTYDGATQLGKLNLNNSKSDLILLFTDGISTIGESIPQTGNKPVYCISSETGADYPILNHISLYTGGTTINLSQTSCKEALSMLAQQSYRLLSANYNKNEITDFTFLPTSISPSSGIGIAGKLKCNQSEVELIFGYGDGNNETIRIHFDADKQISNSGMAERLWATTRVVVLDMNYKENKDEISRLAKDYNIVTRNTSLIVLDRIEDYILYDITPPEELMKEYLRLKEKINKSETKQKQSHTDYVVKLFRARKQWWKGENYSHISLFTENSENHLESSVSFESEFSGDVPPPPPVPYFSEELRVVEDDIMVMESIAIMDDADYQSEAYIIAEEEIIEEPGQVIGRSSMSEEEVPLNDIIRKEKKAIKSSFAHLYPSSNFTSAIRLEKKEQREVYLQVFDKVNKNKYYSTYIELRKEYKDNPIFYTDIASLFRQKGLKDEAFIILSNLAELELESHKLLRSLAHCLLQWNYTEPAIFIFEKVKELRPDEAQSFRDLARAYEQKGDYQKAVNLLHTITSQAWDSRFPEIEVIAVTEMNKVIARAERENKKVNTSHIDTRLLENLPVDIRVVIGWSTDNTDIDLWVTDPLGEVCKYSNRSTRIRGAMSYDFTQGFGPEEFMLKQAIKGKYTIQANYYGSHEQTLKEPVMIYMDIYTRYAQKGEEKQSLIFRLSNEREVLTLGSIEIK